MIIKESLKGRIFGRLTVVSRDFSKIGAIRGSYWWCNCVCGNVKSISRHSLVNHGTKSCGCLQKESARKALKPDNLSSKKAWLKKYKNRAKTQKVPFEFSLIDFLELCYKNCYYCDSPPEKRNPSGYKRKGKEKAELSVNGLDRIVPCSGYTIDNVVTCCTTCNRMRMDDPQEEFILKVNEIAKKHVR